jgi:homoserine kinase
VRVDELLELALQLEPHADNLAPALAGGVCLTWSSGEGQRIARVADDLPLEPIAVVPDARVETAAARAALPGHVSHADAVFTATHAVLLGAGLTGNDPALLAAALADRLHEPYRGPLSPVYGPIREQLPAGAVGVTISGSGPTVLVWAGREEAASCARELATRFPRSRVLQLGVASAGAGLSPR